MNSSDEDPEQLLSAEGQWTEPWGGANDGEPCDKCEGNRTTGHECWSCLIAGVREDCPVCGGEVRWETECPVCRGTGRIDGKPRHGVSVFPTAEGLYHYMLSKDADLDDCVVVELEGEPSGDADFDADEGAMLVSPTAIHRCGPVDPSVLDRVNAQTPD